MENQTTAPAQGEMEHYNPELYQHRRAVMLSYYEMHMLMDALRDSNKTIRALINDKLTERELHSVTGMLLARTELSDRIKKAKEEGYPELPF